MAAITRIDFRIQTANQPGAGTDGDVWGAVAGREFYLDSSANDFEQGDNRTYTCGDGSNVLNAADNDPRHPQLDTADVDRFPTYVRFEPGGNWVLEEAEVTVNPGPQQIKRRALAGGAQKLVLGPKASKIVFLK